MDNKTMFFNGNTVIVTENVYGEIYLIESKYIQDIVDDWIGDCNFVPLNNARVFFASYNNKPISPYEYTNFGTLVRYLQSLIR